jgi:hypothetical protein
VDFKKADGSFIGCLQVVKFASFSEIFIILGSGPAPPGLERKIEKLFGYNLGRVLTTHSTDWVHGLRSFVKNYYTKSDEVIEMKYKT